jgi:hypothetical protein
MNKWNDLFQLVSCTDFLFEMANPTSKRSNAKGLLIEDYFKKCFCFSKRARSQFNKPCLKWHEKNAQR